MKKTFRLLLLLIISLFIVITPFGVLIAISESTPNPYKMTYLYEFNDKYDRLVNTNTKKIVFVGGSCLPFGLNSKLIENNVKGYKVVNFGLYGTLGTKFMIDMSKANINKNDIVVLTPELYSQTYSLYFNPDTVLQTCDGFSDKYKLLSWEDNKQLFFNYFGYSFKKFDYSIHNNAPDPVGIYRYDSFDEYGDIYVDRESNIMLNGYDSTTKITVGDELLNKEFIDYVNNYISFVQSKGAKIYFSFSPNNQKAIYSSRTNRQIFQSKLKDAINCDLLMDIEDSIIDYRFFYDTNFHLNSVGADYYSSLVSNSLNKKLARDSYIDIDEIVPPSIDDGDSIIDDDDIDDDVPVESYKGEANNSYVDAFKYKLVGKNYQIVGVNDEYKDMEEVILPYSYNDKTIVSIATDAFNGCSKLKNIYIGKHYKMFEAKCFNTCSSLEGIYLYVMDGNTLTPSNSDFLTGTNDSVRIYIPIGSNYSTGYTWSNYESYFSYFEV